VGVKEGGMGDYSWAPNEKVRRKKNKGVYRLRNPSGKGKREMYEEKEGHLT